MAVAQKVRDWFVPISRTGMTLREANASMSAIRLTQDEVPFRVQLVENPAFDIPLLDVFHGATRLETHDHLHIVLGRGLLPKDEAFVVGFTMGSTDQVDGTEEFLYGLFVRLGFVSDCQSLCEADFVRHLDRPLEDVRAGLGIETPLLRAYYAIEKRRYPGSYESQRLLD